MSVDITFIKSGRGKAQCPADPAYPDGIELRPPPQPGGDICFITLPYPAPECGFWNVRCDICRQIVMITAAGRADDPRSVQLPCQMANKTDTGERYRAN